MRTVSLYNKIFFIFVMGIIISISIVAWYGFNSTSKAYIKAAYNTSYENSAILEVAIEAKLSHVPKDVRFATDFYALKKFMTWRLMDEDTKANKWKQLFSHALLDFLYNKKDYYQARVIDLDGNELINAQYIASLDKTLLLDESQLQNKKGRDYVEQTKKLKKGEFHVSSMNLNVEHGKVEQPSIPVIRYSTPIVGPSGEAIAIFVVNFYAQSILDLVDVQRDKDREYALSYYLVKKDGDYLYHERKEKRWASQLKHKSNFNTEYFSMQSMFKEQEHGSFSLNKKIYSFHEVQAFSEQRDNFWYIISSVDEKKALAGLEEFKTMFFIIILLVVLGSFFIVRLFILSITNPISQVTRQLNALSRGEIQKEDITYMSNDAVGQIVKSTQKVTLSIEKIIKQANLVAEGDLDKKIELLGDNDKLGKSINDMTTRLKEIESLAQNLSQGNYDTKIVAKGSNDELGLALIGMISYLKHVTELAESISKGNIEVNYKATGPQDRLGIAMLKMISYLNTVAKQANAISKKDFSQTIHVKSSNDVLGSAMATMTSILSATYIKNTEELYFSEGIGEFSDKITGIEDSTSLAQEAITVAARYVDAASGILYIYDEKSELLNEFVSFAHVSGNKIVSFRLGEGIVGQVGFDKKPMYLQGIENDSLSKVESGTILSKTQELFVFPLIHEGKLLGVCEIMSFTKLSKIKRDYLLKASGIFTTGLYVVGQNAQIKILLEKSQRAFEELQLQSEELQESNVQMEEQQQQLTLQSSELKEKNDTLAQAKDEIDKRAEELERISRYKSEFLANMSHELRTPLNSIILLSKLLANNKKDSLNQKDIEKVMTINKSGNDLLFLINDILDLTKIESGNMELDLSKVSSADILEDMKSLFKDVAQEKGIEFLVKDSFNSGFIGDKSKLGQVLKNLLSNAMKFTKEGSVHLELSKNNNNVEILVQDTGIGIPEDKINSIFEAFKQVDGSINREFGGTGLGLSITKTIVELMGGSIVVHSELGEGSSFVIILPLTLDVVNKILEPEIPKKSHETQILSALQNEFDKDYFEDELQGKNILIVDDDSRNIFALTSALESSGAEIYTAFNGQEALDLLNEESEIMDLILMDVMMPVMDGLVAMEHIRAHPKHKNIPIIAVTAKTTAEDKKKCLESGADEYLAKPIEFNALFVMIKAWIA